MARRNDVIVIGAGHNGLVAASYLARRGLNVLVVEAANSAGGMAASRSLGDDYHFPGLAVSSYPLHSDIRRDLKLDRYGYREGPAASTVSLQLDGSHLTIGAADIAGDNLSDEEKQRYATFVGNYRDFARALRPLLENAAPRLKHMSFADKKTLAKIGWKLRFGLGRDSMYEFLRVAAINIYDVLNEEFEDDRIKGALSADAILGSAMGPRTPGSVLTWLQRLHGCVSGEQSIANNSLVSALCQSAEDAGVEIRYGTDVHRILIENDKAFGVETTDGEMLKASRVVSSIDPRTTFLSMVGARKLDTQFANRVTQIRGSGVVAKLNLALSGTPEFTELGDSKLGDRLLVAPDSRYVERAFNASKYGQYSEHPVLDIALPSAHDRSLAPKGHHVMSINVAYVPYSLEGGWTEQRSTLAYKVIAQLGQYAPNLKSLIVDHEFLTPADIEEQFGAVDGHWHHGELSIHQSFMMRPLHGAAQYDTPIAGLYLCGAGNHPGGGLTGLPGRNAAKRIIGLGGTR